LHSEPLMTIEMLQFHKFIEATVALYPVHHCIYFSSSIHFS
jgi:hypothetical protein